MRRTRALLCSLLVLTVAAGAGCGSDGNDSSDPAKLRKELSSQFQKGDSGLTEKQADCFAGVLIDEIGAEKLADVDFSAAEPPEALQDDFTAAAVKAVSSCKIDLGSG